MIVGHPIVIRALFGSLHAPEPRMPGLPWMPGTKLAENPLMAVHPTCWVFPRESLVEHEKSDEPWCRYFRIGHEAEDLSRWNLLVIEEAAFAPLTDVWGLG